jgi:hypothetical protein
VQPFQRDHVGCAGIDKNPRPTKSGGRRAAIDALGPDMRDFVIAMTALESPGSGTLITPPAAVALWASKKVAHGAVRVQAVPVPVVWETQL